MKEKFLLLVLVLSQIYGYSQPNTPPNILFIGVDDMADWVGCMDGYPGEVLTPNIDRLANRGVLFTNAHCTSPVCGPSRAAILTGLQPEVSGVYHNIGRYNDYTDAVGFPLYFRQNGYTSLGAGKINHGYGREIYDNWDDYGPDTKWIGGPINEEEMSIEGMDPTKYIKRFDVTLPQNPGALVDRPFNKYSTWDYCAFDIPDCEMPDGRIALWGIEQLQKKHEKPFLIACGFYRPHQPFYVPQKYFDMYDLDEVVLPETIAGDMFDIPVPGINLAHGAWSSGKHETCIKYNQWKPLIRGYLAAISFAVYNSIKEKLKKYLPQDRYKQYIRYGDWKACVLNSGEMELYNVKEGAGIAEQENIAKSNPEIVFKITEYLSKNSKSKSFVNIPDNQNE